MNKTPRSAGVAGKPEREYGGVGPQARRALRRQKLMDAAMSLFGAFGLNQTTMRGICVEARLVDRYFYESFANVPEIFSAVFVQQRAQAGNYWHDRAAALPC